MAAIAILATALTLNQLGQADVCGFNEAVEGVFLQQMVEHGELLFPLENGEFPMYKPPLFHWTATAIDRLAGVNKVTAFNLRLPSALYAIAGVILAMAFAYGRLGPGAAMLAGLILIGSYQYISQGRIGRVDMALTFFETLALFSFLWWLPAKKGPPSTERRQTGSDAMRYLCALALGLAVVAKGPVGALLPIGAIVLFLWLEGRWRELGALLVPGPAIVMLVVGSSWYLACLFSGHYGFLNRQIGSENLGRFFGALGAMPPWYYVRPLLLNSPPLSLLVPLAVISVIRGYGASAEPADTVPNRSAHGGERDAVRLFTIFYLVTVAFFTVAAYKRRAYLLPLWPSSAVLLAWWLRMTAQRYRAYLWGRYAREAVAAICAVLVVFNFFFIPWREDRACRGDSFRMAAAQINRVVGSDEPLHVYGLAEPPAALLFYLDRDAPLFKGKLGDAPPGYVLLPAEVWQAHKEEALDLNPVLTIAAPRTDLVLLRHGKAYAALGNRAPGEVSF